MPITGAAVRRSAEPALALVLFGTPAVVAGDRPVRIALKRGYALLAFLALEARAVARDVVAQFLWPDAGAAVARTRLRRLIYAVETACASDLIETRESALSLRAGALRCDAVEFRNIARSLVEGSSPAAGLPALVARAHAACTPLLEGFACDSSAVDDWIRTRRIEHEHLLVRLLARLADIQLAQGDHGAAAATVERVISLDPYSEPAYVQRMHVAAAAADAAAVDAVFMRCAEALRAEFGLKPSPATERAYLDAKDRAAVAKRGHAPAGARALAPIDVRFARGEDGAVAYATFGRGNRALVVMPGFVSHIEIALEHPGIREVLGALAQQFTVVVFDRRGVGLSDRLASAGTVAAAAADVLTILDAAGIERAWLFGSSEGGPAALLLAATQAARVDGLVLFGSMAKGCRDDDYPWALRAEAYDRWMQALVEGWGSPADLETFAPALRDDPATRAWWARMLRHAASPSSLRAVLEGFRDADVRPLLGAIRQPVLVMHRRGDRAVRFEAGEHLARSIPGARFLPLEGTSHWWWVEDTAAVLAGAQEFLAGHARA